MNTLINAETRDQRVQKFLLASITMLSIWHGSAQAESPGVLSANVLTCNVAGTVELTILGLTKIMKLPCLNQTEKNSLGASESNAADANIGVPGVLNLAAVEAPNSLSGYLTTSNSTMLNGGARASSVQLAQGLVKATAVGGAARCTITAGSKTITCEGETALETLTVNGQQIPLPPQPMPIGYPLAKVQGKLTVSVLNIPVKIPVSGVLKGNDFVVSGLNSEKISIQHAPLKLQLEGDIKLGLSLVKVKVNIVDVSDVEFESDEETESVTTHAVAASGSSFDCTGKSNGNYSNPESSCSNIFYSCWEGTAIKQSCPSNLFFDPEVGNCDMWRNIPACGGTPPSNPTKFIVK